MVCNIEECHRNFVIRSNGSDEDSDSIRLSTAILVSFAFYICN
jgi:hypothetical protein